jgi:PknH-like extracellular domain
MRVQVHWRRAIVLVLGCLLLAGCTKVADGSAIAARGLQLGPLSGADLEKILPTESELAKVLGESIPPDPDKPQVKGDLSDMADGLATESDASPHKCVGVIAELQRSIYQDTKMTEFASARWREPSGSTSDLTRVITAVVAFPSTSDANDAFDDFAKQWKSCDGTLVKIPIASDYFGDDISNVQNEDAVMSADIEVTRSSNSIRWPNLRAIGVRANCLVEVELTFFGGAAAPTKFRDTAIAVTRSMMDRIAEVG